ncbi:hypothetical protein [Coralloluteibacterium thermophilus]|uniref:Uncharacterized protein n=1 Tax=Coralloluteibacterium thermophilum TaxID=2707049 RepID=A0ABV9NGU5_9GAMM
MPWVQIADAGVQYEFDDHGFGGAEMSGSVIRATDMTGGFSVHLWDTPRRFRLTFSDYRSHAVVGNEGLSYVVYYPDDEEAFVYNGDTARDAHRFVPNPVETSETWSITYGAGAGTETSRQDSFEMRVEVWADGPQPEVSYNCECEDEHPSRTLAELRTSLMRRLGFSAQAANPPPGMAELLNDFLYDAQQQLIWRYDVLRTERFFTWDLLPGVRFYDLVDNVDTCTVELDPRKLSWVGVERDGRWYELIQGIPPELYSRPEQNWRPTRFEIRQCIEVHPAPDVAGMKLRVKGRFPPTRFREDEDRTSIDHHAVFLLALANAKAHYQQPDAGNYVQQLEVLIRKLVAGAHGTRRYIPGARPTFPRDEPQWEPLP